MKKMLLLAVIVGLGSFQCLQPNYVVKDDLGKADEASAVSDDAIYFFDDKYGENGYGYAYPEKTSQIQPDEDVFKAGTDGLKISLDTKVYAGFGVGRSAVDLSKIRNKGSLRFWIRGTTGKEEGITIGFADSPANGGAFVTGVQLGKYCRITKDWQEVAIPLADFDDGAHFWDEASQSQKSGKMEWNDVVEISVSTEPMAGGKNMIFYIDELRVDPQTKSTRIGGPVAAIVPATSWTPARTVCGKYVMAYYPSWVATFKSDLLPLDQLTHVFHSFILPSADGDFIGTSGFIEPELINACRLKNVKVVASIGGANAEAKANFRIVAASASLRQKFADNLEAFCRKNGYDGVDLDWEFPESPEDRANEVLLMKAVREKFNSSPAPAPNWLITKAAAAGNWYGQWSNYDELAKYMDFFNVMTYDFHGEWSGHSGHNAALLTGKDTSDPESSCEGALIYMTNTRKVPRSKIMLGLAFYGQMFPKSKALYSEGDSTTIQMNYNLIVPYLSDKTWAQKWDSASLNPYMESTTGLGVLVYDDVRSLREKVKFAWQKNLGGVFIWDITADYVEGENKLMPAVYDEASKQCAGK